MLAGKNRWRAPGRDSRAKEAQKDSWDKLDILTRGLAGVFIPAVVAVSVYLWNAERTRFETASSMLQIAVGILQEPAEKTPQGKALRDWAISVMKSPKNPPTITEDVAIALATDQLPQIALAPLALDYSKLKLDFTSNYFAEAMKKINPQPWKPLFDCTPAGCTLKTEPISPEDLDFDWEQLVIPEVETTGP